MKKVLDYIEKLVLGCIFPMILLVSLGIFLLLNIIFESQMLFIVSQCYVVIFMIALFSFPFLQNREQRRFNKENEENLKNAELEINTALSNIKSKYDARVFKQAMNRSRN